MVMFSPRSLCGDLRKETPFDSSLVFSLGDSTRLEMGLLTKGTDDESTSFTWVVTKYTGKDLKKSTN